MLLLFVSKNLPQIIMIIKGKLLKLEVKGKKVKQGGIPVKVIKLGSIQHWEHTLEQENRIYTWCYVLAEKQTEIIK